jgi:hypothetical protein
MKKTALALVALSMATSAAAMEDMTAAEFFARDKANKWTGDLVYPSNPYGKLVKLSKMTPEKQEVVAAIQRHVTAQLGSKWVDTALRIAKLESGFSCRAKGPRTRHGNAKGVFQLIDSSARTLGFSPAQMYDCEQNILAGVAHMKACIEQGGVREPREMAACHVAGWANWNVKLARRPERYKQRYVSLAIH